MSDSLNHDVVACARAWQTLRLAHDRVAEQLDDDLSRQCGLAMSEFDVLLYLRTHQETEVHIGDLQETVALSQPALSRLVARLEERGLVQRSAAEVDGRATAICLTGDGADLIERAIQVHANAVHERLTSRFSPEEQEMLLDLLAQIGR